MRLLFLLLSCLALLSPFSAFALGDLYLDGNSLYFATDSVFEGSPVRVYANVNNPSDFDLKAIVRFYLGNQSTQIGSDQTVSVLAKNSDIAFVDLYPPVGQHSVIAKVFPWDPSADDAGNNTTQRSLWVQADFDKDKIADEDDPDDDNDGVLDINDDFPRDASEQIDSDADGVGNNADTDDDNDDVLDDEDAFPLDATESKNADGDKLGDNADPDDDNDGLSDIDEAALGSDPFNEDTDGDYFIDGEDLYVLDPNEAQDSDGDGIGNNADNDDDNDGLEDARDPLTTK